MENLKIRVNSEAENKEAQELFFGLGYKDRKNWTQRNPIHESIQAWADGEFTFSLNHNQVSVGFKEITLPQLRDLVVLKRNSIDDATHTDGHHSFYVGKDKNYFFSSCYKAWRGTWKNVDILKPIEKPMKEYLRKNSNDTYSYIGTVRPEHVSDFMIEIPEGCNIITCENRKGNLVYFHWKSLDSDEFFLKDEKIWSNNFNETLSDFIEKNEGDVKIIWSRHTHPEELPFIDDEPIKRMKAQDEVISIPKSELEKFGFSVSLNDQYAEIEKVRQSHRTASEIADSALKHIRERAETYDQPTGERSAAKTAKAFNAITGKDITESEVWLLLQLLKDVRQWSREDYHQDSAEDCIAYAALKAESLEGGE